MQISSNRILAPLTQQKDRSFDGEIQKVSVPGQFAVPFWYAPLPSSPYYTVEYEAPVTGQHYHPLRGVPFDVYNPGIVINVPTTSYPGLENGTMSLRISGSNPEENNFVAWMIKALLDDEKFRNNMIEGYYNNGRNAYSNWHVGDVMNIVVVDSISADFDHDGVVELEGDKGPEYVSARTNLHGGSGVPMIRVSRNYLQSWMSALEDNGLVDPDEGVDAGHVNVFPDEAGDAPIPVLVLGHEFGHAPMGFLYHDPSMWAWQVKYVFPLANGVFDANGQLLPREQWGRSDGPGFYWPVTDTTPTPDP